MSDSNRQKRFTFRNSITLFAVSVAVSMTLALAANAQSATPPADTINLKNTACKAGLPCGDVSAVEIVTTIINIVLSLVGVVTVVMIIYGGVLYMTAAGNEEKVKKARGLLVNSVIGLAIILTAFSVSTFVFRRLQRSTYVPAPASTDRCANYAGGSCAPTPCGGGLTDYGQLDCAAPQVCCAP